MNHLLRKVTGLRQLMPLPAAYFQATTGEWRDYWLCGLVVIFASLNSAVCF